MLYDNQPLAIRPSVKRYEKLRRSTSTPQVEVQKYEALKEVITTFHNEKRKPIDWGDLATSSPPFTGEIGPNEARINKLINDYKPNGEISFLIVYKHEFNIGRVKSQRSK